MTHRLDPLHRHLYEALDSLRGSSALRDILGDDFVTVYAAIKDMEYREFQERIPECEREELMLIV